MSTPPYIGVAPQSLNGPPSPFKSFSVYQDPDQNQSSDLIADQFTLRQDSLNEPLEIFRPEMEAMGPQFVYDSSTHADDSNLVVPASRNDNPLNMNNQVLHFPPKFDPHMASFSESSNIAASSSSYGSQQHDGYHANQILIQEQFQQQQNLYPAMMISSSIVDQDIPLGSQMGQGSPSFSNTTASSMDPMHPTFASSISKQSLPSSQSQDSLASSISTQNLTATPRRPVRLQSTSNTTQAPGLSSSLHQTPTQVLKRTPSTRVTKSHRRTRSRLSLDATSAAIASLQASTSTTNLRSPAPSNGGGTNPFYTPSVYHSPHQGSPSMTPLATPQVAKREISSYSSISPLMLMNPSGKLLTNEVPTEELSSDVFAEAANMTLRLASHYAYSTDSNDMNTIAGSSRSHQRTNTVVSIPASQNFLVDPTNIEPNDLTEVTTNSSESSSSSRSTTSSSTPITTHQRTKTITNLQTPTVISRSQSAFNLASISKQNPKLIPPEITKYDIITPRKQNSRLQKSQSSAELSTLKDEASIGTKQKKMHSCPLCSAVFQRPEHVKRHMRSHSSEKPFVCDEPNCGKRFNRGDNMKAHLRKIHGRQI